MFDFVFGPNRSFYARAFGKTFCHNLPPALTRLLSDPKQAELVYCVALGPDASYFVAYKDVKTGRAQVDGKDVSPKLDAWLYADQEKLAISPKRHVPTMRVYFGKDKSYFAYDRKGYSCSHITTALVDFMESEVEARGSYYPTMVGIGTHGLFIVERAELKKWNAPTEHPKLKAYLDPEYAKESGQSGYFLEGKLQRLVIDPFTTPAQVIIQDQNGWLYDIPQLAQDGAASKVIEEMNQHVLIAPPMPKLVPTKSPDSKPPEKSIQETEKDDHVPEGQPAKPPDSKSWQMHTKKPTPIMPQVGDETPRKARLAASVSLSARKERDPYPKVGPVTAGVEDRQPRIGASPRPWDGRPKQRPVPIYDPFDQPSSETLGETHTPEIINAVERKPSKASPRIGAIETIPALQTKEPRLRTHEELAINRLLQAQAHSLQMIQKTSDELRLHIAKFNRITEQLEEARAQTQRPKPQTTTSLDPATSPSSSRRHHRAPSIRSLRDRLDDLRAPQLELPTFGPMFPDRTATNKTPAPVDSRGLKDPYLQPGNPFRSSPVSHSKSASNLSLSDTWSRSGSTTPIEPSPQPPPPPPPVSIPKGIPTASGSDPSLPAPNTAPAVVDGSFILRLQGLFGPENPTATVAQRDAMARLWELYGTDGPLRSELLGMTQAQVLVAMAWSLDMDVNNLAELFGGGLSYAMDVNATHLEYMGMGMGMGVGMPAMFGAGVGMGAAGSGLGLDGNAALAAGCTVM